MRAFGFTLIDLLTTLSITSILLAVGMPNLSGQIQRMRISTATQSLLEAIDLTRTAAVSANKRATITNQALWENGWKVFIDKNNNGIRDADEVILQQHEKLNGVRIITNTPVKNYVSYIGTGESRNASGTAAGGFQAGTFKVCPIEKGKGYELILARGGRVRQHEISEQDCAAM